MVVVRGLGFRVELWATGEHWNLDVVLYLAIRLHSCYVWVS